MGGKSKGIGAAAPSPIEATDARGEAAIHSEHVPQSGPAGRVDSPAHGSRSPRHDGLTWTQLTLALAGRALLRPQLAADLARAVWAFRRRGWFRAPPFVPLPPPEYVRWRMYTAYGDENAVPPLEDVIRFVRWRRHVMHL